LSDKSAAGLVLAMGAVLSALALTSGKTGEQKFKRLYGSFWLWVLLGLAADISPELAGPFAGLVLIAAVAKDTGVIGRFVSGNAPLPGQTAAQAGASQVGAFVAGVSPLPTAKGGSHG
jgi:hypothetical protein